MPRNASNEQPEERQGPSIRTIAILIGSGIAIILLMVIMHSTMGRNDLATYQILQGYNGSVEVISSPGYFNKKFGTTWEYPLNKQAYFSKSPKEGSKEDESIKVHFNDAGTADISSFIMYALPTDSEKRLALHKAFGGNITNIEHAIHAHMANCIKSSGPLMSASENQSSRKSEFNQVVEEQLRHGLYEMRRTMVTLKDRLDDKGQPITVEATEILRDTQTGVPIRAEKSPLETYGIDIQQFSITDTTYDEPTLQQFLAKQGAFLSAEKSKAQREQEIQQRLMIEQQGLRQVAEIEAAANQVKAKALTEATQRVEVAIKTKVEAETLATQAANVAEIQAQQKVKIAAQAKLEAETLANQQLQVAEINKKAAETLASQQAAVAQIAAEQKLKVAQLEAESAKKQAEGIISLAEAEQKKITIGGAVRENDKILATIQAERDVKVAEGLSKIQVPQNITILGGGNGGMGEGKSTDATGMLMNLVLLKSMLGQSGALPTTAQKQQVVQEQPVK